MERPGSRARPVAIATAAVLLTAATATAATIEGPQLTDRPPGFMFDSNCSAARIILPHERERGQRCYATHGESPDWITLTRFEGSTSDLALRSALEGYVAKWGDSPGQSFGEIFPLEIDGRPGLAVYDDSTYRLALHALVSYDDETWSIEFAARNPELRDKAFLEATVASFAREPSSLPGFAVAVALMLVAGAGIGLGLRSRRTAAEAAERAARDAARAELATALALQEDPHERRGGARRGVERDRADVAEGPLGEQSHREHPAIGRHAPSGQPPHARDAGELDDRQEADVDLARRQPVRDLGGQAAAQALRWQPGDEGGRVRVAHDADAKRGGQHDEILPRWRARRRELPLDEGVGSCQ